ncbi:MAG: zinc ribbon domain-containing protein [Lachnospiraceae bacterium]|nr:zinc ribbon domain-containing protein [Lachnospiraceae bacterium]
MFCTKCGSKLPDGVRFCINCGAPVTAAMPAQAAPAPTPEPAPVQTPEVETPVQQPQAQPVNRKLPKQYRVLNVMEYGEDPWPYVYPTIDLTGQIVPEPQDHVISAPVVAKSVSLECMADGEKNYRTVFRLSDIAMNIYVSDARVMFLCDQYDKGGTWHGGLTAIALTAIERGVAKARTNGKTLAGHIRLEWLKHIMYMHKSGILYDESMRLVYCDRAETFWRLDVSFPKSVDAVVIANDIMHRAAALRSTMDGKGKVPESSLQFYREHADSSVQIQLNPDKKTFSKVSFPECILAPGGKDWNPNWPS